VACLSGLFFGRLGGHERGGVAERFTLALETAGAVLWAVTLALPVGSEFATRDLATDDVGLGHESGATRGEPST
jgi:hypothetical protein